MRVLLWLVLAGALPAQALELQADRHYRQVHGDFLFELNTLPVDTHPALVRERVAAQFAPVPGQQLDFGFTARTVWLFLPLSNHTRQASTWVLALNTRFMNDIAVYQWRSGQWQTLMRNSENSDFGDRPLDYRHLAVDFDLDAGEDSELLIGYTSRGTSYLPVSIESEQSFADMRELAVARSAGFYTAAALMFLYGLFQWLLLGNRIHLHYILYLGAAVLYVFHMDGLSFQYLWPQLPGWNAFAALPLGLLINVAAASFSRHFLQTWRTAPRFDRVIVAIMWACALALLWGVLVEDQQVKRVGFWLSSIGAAVYLAAGVNALLGGQRFARFYVAGWIGICSAAVVSSLVHSFPGVLPVALAFEVTKAGILFDALMFGMAMADQAAEVRRQRDAALEREMRSLAEQARTRNALQAAQAGRNDALRLAREKSLQLAGASHDIRQPLAALKVALAQMPGSGGSPGDALESVAYLDALVSGYLDNARAEHAAAPSARELQEPFPVQLVLDAVTRMFSAEAGDKGLRLRCRPSSAQVVGDPLATVRIVSNLVKNAIAHTGSGGVLIGCRRSPGHCTICVADSGGGMDPAQRERLQRAFEQGDESREGHGLGLHIVNSLCRREGYDFTLDSVAGAGVIARVRLELATGRNFPG
ncbi:sensor histidine kinase [Mangrovimicrobium sediminis]|nr:sensor histidine kinase [Haliea sp. SAOS-164]